MADADFRDLATRYGPLVGLLLVFVFMVWVRIRPRERVITDSAVLFSGNDPWYHARMVNFAVEYFPWTPMYDPFSYFPYGTGRHSGFGGLFDQLIAFAALVVGVGDPGPRLVEVVTAYAPAVFGALTLIPLYLLAKRLMGRWWALLTAGLLALTNGQFLTRTIIGVSDHQSAEAFFGTLAIVGFVYAFQAAYVEQPTWADVQDRNWLVLKRPLYAGVLGGVALASYLMMWAPGVFLVFTIGVFVVLQLSREHLRGNSTEYLVFGTVVSMVTAAVLTMLYAKSYVLEATAFSLLQPLVLLGIAAGSVVMWQLSERFREESYEPIYYPVAVGGLIAAFLVVATVIHPPTLDLIRRLFVRIYSFGFFTNPQAGTVAEIAPATIGDAWRAYAGFFPIAILGFLLLVYRVLQENRPLELLLVLWSLTITSAYFTMIRFGYYFGVTVALLTGVAVWWTAKTADLDELNELADIQTYQVLVVLIVIVAIVPGNVVAVGGTSAPVWETADRRGGANTAWQGELRWVRNSTPEVQMAYYGQYDQPADNDFDYPDGAYGVMSWWDYGHWITYTGQRIPNANPFQQGPRSASAFLLAQNETRANLILEALASGESRSEIHEMSIEELRTTIDAQSPNQADEDTRYVMIDDQMAAGKFSAIATWTGPGAGAFFSREEFRVADTQAQLIGTNDRYDDTMLARLYLQDARGLSHYRLVHESGQSAIVSVAQQTPGGQWQSTSFVHRRLNSQVFAAVQQRPDLTFYNVHQPATVKTFERVPGATLTGQVETENATTVFATVELQTNRNRTFTYVQSVETDEEGNFEMTVPYATTDTVGPAEGGTDSAVEATGKYELFAGNPFRPVAQGNTSVPEPAIYDGETIRVELEPIERDTGNETNTSDEGNSSAIGTVHEPSTSASFGTASGTTDVTSGAVVAEPRQATDG